MKGRDRGLHGGQPARRVGLGARAKASGIQKAACTGLPAGAERIWRAPAGVADEGVVGRHGRAHTASLAGIRADGNDQRPTFPDPRCPMMATGSGSRPGQAGFQWCLTGFWLGKASALPPPGGSAAGQAVGDSAADGRSRPVWCVQAPCPSARPLRGQRRSGSGRGVQHAPGHGRRPGRAATPRGWAWCSGWRSTSDGGQQPTRVGNPSCFPLNCAFVTRCASTNGGYSSGKRCFCHAAPRNRADGRADDAACRRSEGAGHQDALTDIFL